MTRKLTPAQLDEIEATAKDEMDSGWRIVLMNPAATLALVAEVRELRAKVERVRELHRENAYPDRPMSRCRDCDDVWPCETARALGEEA